MTKQKIRSLYQNKNWEAIRSLSQEEDVKHPSKPDLETLSIILMALGKTQITRSKTKQIPTNQGLTIKQILNSPFVAFTHGTNVHMEYDEHGNREENIDNFFSIIDSGEITNQLYRLTKQELEQLIDLKNRTPKEQAKINWHSIPENIREVRIEQYPGVYCVPELNTDYVNVYSNDFTFIISLALFAKRGWHVRGYSPYGGYGALIDTTVWDYTSFGDYLNTIDPKELRTKTFPEMVFHYPISLAYVEAIICISKFKNVASNAVLKSKWKHISVYTKLEFKKLPLTKRIKFLYTKNQGPYSSFDANLCYNSGGEFEYDRPGRLSKKELRHTLMNCGFTEEEARKTITKTSYDKVMSLIVVRGIKSIRDKKYYTPKVHPPYITGERTKLTIFDWNVAWDQYDKASLKIQRETIKANLADVYAFQELNDIKNSTFGPSQKENIDYMLGEDYIIFGAKSGVEEMYTYIKRDLNPKLVKKGEFGEDRPFLINLFTIKDKTILFINIHPGYKSETEKTLQLQDIKTLNTAIKGTKFDRLIIVGDFNINIDYVILGDKIAYNIVGKEFRKDKYTCCNEFRLGKNGNKDEYGFVDHILDSKYNDDTKSRYRYKLLWDDYDIVNPSNNKGSDHSPILAKLPL